MIRALILAFAILCSLSAAPGFAQSGAPGWIKLASASINAAAGGSKTIDLPDITFRALRFTADKPVAIATIKTSSGGAFKASGGPFTALPATPSDTFYKSNAQAGLKQVELTWSAQPGSGTVRIEIWALVGPEAVNRGGDGSKRENELGDLATRAHKTTPPPTRSISAPAPKVESAPPPKPGTTPPPAPTAEAPHGRSGAFDKSAESARPSPPPVPPVVASRSGPANVCTDEKICTIVDVFYGTDRNAVPGKDRLGYGTERARRLELGHAFVTVPKANRNRGQIPLPSAWDRWVRGVPPEGDPSRHFTIPKNGVISFATEDEFIAAAKAHIANAGEFKDHAFIFIHGFAVTFDEALYRTAQISYDLSGDGKPFGTAFAYSWPSQGNVLTGYVTDAESANFAQGHLLKFIKTVVERTGVKNVHFIAHSMGNVALLGALSKYAETETSARINQIILASPDFDKAEFERIAANVAKLAKRTTMYASQSDKALMASRRAHSNLQRAGETSQPPGPAITNGVDTIDVTSINTDALWGHDKYADSPELLADIASVFIKGEAPPKRSPNFQLGSLLGSLQYWIYKK